MKHNGLALLASLVLLPAGTAAEPSPLPGLSADACRAFALRNVGPLLSSGRIADVVVDPRQPSVWYVATASGGVWKTANRGLTWRPIFDQYGSYSIGCLALDPANPDVVWVGTGENQSQRSVGYGDGVYKSTDGGETWKHMGLPNSEHVGKIVIDARNPNVVLVAAQGPLWAPGGDRGLYRTGDLDPRNPDVIYAGSYQRRRNVGVLVGGGPESAIYKSEDGGTKWAKLTNGLPSVDTGRAATSSRTCSRAPTGARAGPPRRATCRVGTSSGRWRKITSTRICSSRAPSSGCSSRPTAAGTGSNSAGRVVKDAVTPLGEAQSLEIAPVTPP